MTMQTAATLVDQRIARVAATARLAAFALRAENRLHGPYTQNINDLKTAIALDPEFGRAYWLLARIYLATGQADLADTAAAEACDIEPKNASFQLCRAQARDLLGRIRRRGARRSRRIGSRGPDENRPRPGAAPNGPAGFAGRS